jgi:hypothetical protein
MEGHGTSAHEILQPPRYLYLCFLYDVRGINSGLEIGAQADRHESTQSGPVSSQELIQREPISLACPFQEVASVSGVRFDLKHDYASRQ